MGGKRVFSGIQPTGNLHLGNYLGAIKQWVARQDEKESFICIVDLHAITIHQHPAELLENTRALAAMLLACGIDPQRTTLFVQSHVRAHAEASWLLSCITPLGWLERMTQFKDKSARQQTIQTGLLTYPVLQAADILLYDADEVPVGEDQKQHIELSRDIAQRFNSLYGETFKLPTAVIPQVAARVMGLDDPTLKMSKSSTAQGHAVRLTDDDEQILKAFKRAVTDSGREIAFSGAPDRAGVNNLLGIYRALTDKTAAQVLADFRDARGYGDLKLRVAEAVVERFRPIRRRYLELLEQPAELDRLVAIGAQRAAARAEPKVIEMKRRMGLLPAG
ncbi:MAG TPA: tryptophan--tRNA ligase [Candidatus Polarisedimenticolaceae bacterium]|nr:tryptophan--tRNA ligase [Candidatus Polarisedimenticolaceae bacterium]